MSMRSTIGIAAGIALATCAAALHAQQGRAVAAEGEGKSQAAAKAKPGAKSATRSAQGGNAQPEAAGKSSPHKVSTRTK